MPVTLKGIYKKFIKYPIKRVLRPLTNKLEDNRLLKTYSLFIQEGDLCFDVGGHKGRITDILLKLKAKVVIVEPHPHYYDYLKKKYNKNDNVIVVGEGLGKKQENITFYPCIDRPVSSSFSLEYKEKRSHFVWGEPIEIPVTTLDDLIDRFGIPNYIKVDVENYEVNVFMGLSKKINFLSFEFHSDLYGKVDKCLRLIDKTGKLRFNYILGNSNKFIFDSWSEEKKLLSSIKAEMDKGKGIKGDIFVSIDGE